MFISFEIESSVNGKYRQLQLPLDLAPEYTLPEEYFSGISVGYTSLHSTCIGEIKETAVQDHPGFAKLRNELEGGGYIKTVRNCSNGDTVLKLFKLNGKWFYEGDRFLSASAMKYYLLTRNSS